MDGPGNVEVAHPAQASLVHVDVAVLEAIGASSRRAGDRERVEGGVDGARPDGMERHAEAAPVRGHRDLDELGRVDPEEARVAGLVAVGLLDGRVPEDAPAIDADLHPEDPEPVAAEPPPDPERGEVLEADRCLVDAVPEPDPEGQLVGGKQRRQVVGLVGQPDHLVDRGDSEGMDVGEDGAQGVESLGPTGTRHHRDGIRAVEAELGALVEDAGRSAVRVALDAAAGRVGRRGIDAGGRQCRAAGRDDVLADAAQHDGPAATRGVELVTVGQPSLGQPGRRQGVALDPPVVGYQGGAGCDVAEDLADRRRREGREVERQPADHRRSMEMGVAVDERGQDRLSREVPDLRPRTGNGADVGVAADGDDPPVGDRDRRSVRPLGDLGVDAPIPQDDLRRPRQGPVRHGLECIQLTVHCRASVEVWRHR